MRARRSTRARGAGEAGAAGCVIALAATACGFQGNGPVDDAGSTSSDAAQPDAVCATGCADPSTLTLCTGGSVSCPAGCGEQPSPHCLQLQPTGLGNSNDLTNVTGSLNVTGGTVVIFTDTGEISRDGTQLRAPGEGI